MEYEITYGDSVEWKKREMIQSVSLKDYYFKLIIQNQKMILHQG